MLLYHAEVSNAEVFIEVPKELDDLIRAYAFSLIFYSSLLAHKVKVIYIMSGRVRIQA